MTTEKLTSYVVLGMLLMMWFVLESTSIRNQNKIMDQNQNIIHNQCKLLDTLGVDSFNARDVEACGGPTTYGN